MGYNQVKDYREITVCNVTKAKSARSFSYGMCFVLLLTLACVVIMYSIKGTANCRSREKNEDWKNFKSRYGKNYSAEEDCRRWQLYQNYKNQISYHNILSSLRITTYTKGVNFFSDLTPSELETFLGYRDTPSTLEGAVLVLPKNQHPPDSINWLQKGAVTGVKDQKLCGSCWAFSSTGSLEGQHFLKTGDLVSLSEQNLLDCSKPEGNMGCLGGLMVNSFRYIMENGGIDTEESYPYEGMDGRCRFQNSTVGATIKKYAVVKKTEIALKSAVGIIGPISVAIDATTSFLSYQSGIFHDHNCDSHYLNHAVLVVGYGSSEGQDFWLVKNSWGEDWGERGYIRMSRNSKNNCGIASKASYPVL